MKNLVLTLAVILLVVGPAYAFSGSTHNFVDAFYENEEKNVATRADSVSCDLAFYDSFTDLNAPTGSIWCLEGTSLWRYKATTTSTNMFAQISVYTGLDSDIWDIWVTNEGLFYIYDTGLTIRVRKFVDRSGTSVTYSEPDVVSCVGVGSYSYCLYDDGTDVNVQKMDEYFDISGSAWLYAGHSSEYTDMTEIYYTHSTLYVVVGQGTYVNVLSCSTTPSCTDIGLDDGFVGYSRGLIKFGASDDDLIIWNDAAVDRWVGGTHDDYLYAPFVSDGSYHFTYGSYSLYYYDGDFATEEHFCSYSGTLPAVTHPLAGVFGYSGMTVLAGNRLITLDDDEEDCLVYGTGLPSGAAYDVCILVSDSLNHYICYDTTNKRIQSLDISFVSPTTTSVATTSTTSSVATTSTSSSTSSTTSVATTSTTSTSSTIPGDDEWEEWLDVQKNYIDDAIAAGGAVETMGSRFGGLTGGDVSDKTFVMLGLGTTQQLNDLQAYVPMFLGLLVVLFLILFLNSTGRW